MERKTFWTDEKFISLSAMLISLCTMGLFIYELNITRRQQYASVLPYLQIRHIEMHFPTYKLSLFNDGLGPAIIKSISVTHGGKEYIGDPAHFLLKSKIINPDSVNFSMTNINPGRLIPAGKQLDMIIASGDIQNAERLSDVFLREDITISVDSSRFMGKPGQSTGSAGRLSRRSKIE